ncbi:DUF3800 domain-containing protein [Leptospira interrogans]|uniref:DUF3800 domain-containing protein n=1 Tax=Leptospira interrogans TaxID=173 RepID=UPI000772D535
MATHCVGIKNSKKIESLIEEIPFRETYSRNSFQHRIVIPFKKEGEFFIGSSSLGIFFVNDPDDAEHSTQFYINRIRQEQRKVISRNQLFKEIALKEQEVSVYFDESGTPDIQSVSTDPFFIVTAIIVNNKKANRELKEQFDHIKRVLHKPEDYEFKSSSLNRKEYQIILKQLSVIDYEFASVCFRKEDLIGEGFSYPKVFYKYAFRFLIMDLLSYTGKVNLIFDEYGGKNSKFQNEFFEYLRSNADGFPIGTISQMEMLSSINESLIQLADIIAGLIKNKVKNKFDFTRYVIDRAIKIEYFPPL